MAIIGPKRILSVAPNIAVPATGEQPAEPPAADQSAEPAPAEQSADPEENEWRPLWGPGNQHLRRDPEGSLPAISLQVWTWGLLRRIPRALSELQEQLDVRHSHARRIIARLRRSGVAIDTTEDGNYRLYYQVPLEVVRRRAMWCMAGPSRLGVSVDQVLTCDPHGRTLARSSRVGDLPFLLPGGADPDLYQYADLFKQIYTQITATIIGAGGRIWRQRPRQPEDLPPELLDQWTPVWGPQRGLSLEAPKSLNIWVWGLLRTMPRSVQDLQDNLGIREGHVIQIVYQLRKRGIPIEMRADGRYYMLDHSPIKIVRTRDGFRMARPGEKAARSIDQLTI